VGREPEFLQDLAGCVDTLRQSDGFIDPKIVKAQVDQILADYTGEDAVNHLLGLAGATDNQIPRRMGLINTVMDCLPDEMAEGLLAGYVNELYV